MSNFTGSVFDYLALYLKNAVLMPLTLGLYFPWAVCNIYRWRVNHTIVDGQPMVFTGKGSDYFWTLLLVGLASLTVVLIPWAQVQLERFVAENTHIA